MATKTKPDRLHYTGNDEADRLIASEPFALLMGQLAYEGDGGPEIAYRFERFEK